VGIENVRREMDVRAVRCDWLTLDATGAVTARCQKVTTEFLPDVEAAQGGPILMDVRWLQLRTGGIQQWYFCSHDHLADWVIGPGAQVLNPGAQGLGTLRTRSET
jgi:hypothetical protein